ncbi:MAG TPA: hypothetical protein VGM92_01800 [Candidatus Kapabacteria bacterium]
MIYSLLSERWEPKTNANPAFRFRRKRLGSTASGYASLRAASTPSLYD